MNIGNKINQKKYKFYLYFYNDSNLGDDLFLLSLLKYFPNIDFYIYDDKNAPPLNKSFNNFSNLHYTNTRFSHKYFESEFPKYDGIVLVGGSVFQDLNFRQYRGHIGKYLIFKRVIQAGKKVFVIGANLGPFNTIFGKLIIKHTLKYISHICVRDKLSMTLLENWHVRDKAYAPDIIFGYDFLPNYENYHAGHILGISVLNTKLNVDIRPFYIKKMVELTNSFLNKSSNNVVRLMGFDGGHEDDGAVIEEIFNLVDSKNRVEKYEYNDLILINDYLSLFVECDYIVACRFHSMVLAVKYRRPFYPIIYSNKTTAVLNDLGYTGESIEYSKIDDLDVNNLLSNFVSGGGIFLLPNSVSRDSFQHFSGLARL